MKHLLSDVHLLNDEFVIIHMFSFNKKIITTLELSDGTEIKIRLDHPLLDKLVFIGEL